MLAYSSLLLDGHDVRMSGQDVKRAPSVTAMPCVMDGNTFEELNRLDNIAPNPGQVFGFIIPC
ncbi:MAG: hypothetical protein R2778_11395 [Saprospiraceae bacterium]